MLSLGAFLLLACSDGPNRIDVPSIEPRETRQAQARRIGDCVAERYREADSLSFRVDVVDYSADGGRLDACATLAMSANRLDASIYFGPAHLDERAFFPDLTVTLSGGVARIRDSAGKSESAVTARPDSCGDVVFSGAQRAAYSCALGTAMCIWIGRDTFMQRFFEQKIRDGELAGTTTENGQRCWVIQKIDDDAQRMETIFIRPDYLICRWDTYERPREGEWWLSRSRVYTGIQCSSPKSDNVRPSSGR